jgi:8-oxo-dGTP diphosphatase
MEDYVLGFMFSRGRRLVVLIRKDRPAWQRGKLNGVGGRIEPGEQPVDAMVREFGEETGCSTSADQWKEFAVLNGEGQFCCHCFAAESDIGTARTIDEKEPVFVLPVHGLTKDSHAMLDNTRWLVFLAIDCLSDGRPAFTTVTYPVQSGINNIDQASETVRAEGGRR